VRKALVIGKSFLSRMNNNSSVELYNKIIEEISGQLNSHYDNNLNVIMEDNDKRKIDSAVLTILNIASHPI